jgi:hypothetical protein
MYCTEGMYLQMMSRIGCNRVYLQIMSRIGCNRYTANEIHPSFAPGMSFMEMAADPLLDGFC